MVGKLSETDIQKILSGQDDISKSISSLVELIDDQSSKIEEQTSKIEDQSSKIDAQTSTIAELNALLKEKDARIRELEERLGKNSRNSSKPSSSDFFNKPKPSTINKRIFGGKETMKRKPGGQKNHKGSTLRVKEAPDAVTRCFPSQCVGCDRLEQCGKGASVKESRTVVDIRVSTFETRYDSVSVECAKCGKTITGEFPKSVGTTLQYGPRLKALVSSLSSLGMVSGERICEIVNQLTGFGMSDGTVCNIVRECAKKCEPIAERLKGLVIASPVVHFDETGIRVNGKIHWAHTSSTKSITLINTHEKRGKEAIDSFGVLPNFKGVAVHDCLAAYGDEEYSGCTHALCGAHLDRELTGVIENTRQRWAVSMKNLFSDMYRKKLGIIAGGGTEADAGTVEAFSKRYDAITERGLSRNPLGKATGKRGRPAKGKVRCLVDRLIKFKDEAMRFLTDFRVPYSNNQAERSFRLSKAKMKIAGSFRSDDGGSNFFKIFSVIDTARKNGVSAFDVLSKIFSYSESLGFLGL